MPQGARARGKPAPNPVLEGPVAKPGRNIDIGGEGVAALPPAHDGAVESLVGAGRVALVQVRDDPGRPTEAPGESDVGVRVAVARKGQKFHDISSDHHMRNVASRGRVAVGGTSSEGQSQVKIRGRDDAAYRFRP